jgi:hypothetical protein
MNVKDKVYIGKVEAYEILSEWGVYELPRKGRVIVNVPAITTGKPCMELGKDIQGFYIGEVIQ